jgi:hypothetical protein
MVWDKTMLDPDVTLRLHPACTSGVLCERRLGFGSIIYANYPT